MNMRHAIAIVGVLFVITHQAAFADPPQGSAIERYAASFAKELSLGGLSLPSIEGSTLDAVETLELQNKTKGTLCWLKNDKGRCGYILFAGDPESPNLLAFSSSVGSLPFAPQLVVTDTKQTVVRRIAGFSFITGVPLVSAQKVSLGTKPVDLTEGPCSAAAVLNYLQYVKGMHFFGHMGYYASPAYVNATPALHPPAERQAMEDRYSKAIAKAKEGGWKPFSEEVKDVLAKENIDPRSGKTPEELAALAEKARELGRPIRRARLLNPVTPQERFELLFSEITEMERVSARDTSRGMRDALLLQEDYFDTSKTLEQNIVAFCETRGLKADVKKSTFAEAAKSLSPCIISYEGKLAGVLLGYVEIDGVDFGFVYFPVNGHPVRMSLAAKLRGLGAKQEPTGVPPATSKDANEEEVRVMVQRVKAMEEKLIVTEDQVSSFPNALENGVHLVRCSTLAHWQVISIGKIVPQKLGTEKLGIN